MPAPKENLTTEIIRAVIAVVSVATFIMFWVLIICNMLAGRYMDVFCLFPATMVTAWAVQRIWDFYYERYKAKYEQPKGK